MATTSKKEKIYYHQKCIVLVLFFISNNLQLHSLAPTSQVPRQLPSGPSLGARHHRRVPLRRPVTGNSVSSTGDMWGNWVHNPETVSEAGTVPPPPEYHTLENLSGDTGITRETTPREPYKSKSSGSTFMIIFLTLQVIMMIVGQFVPLVSEWLTLLIQANHADAIVLSGEVSVDTINNQTTITAETDASISLDGTIQELEQGQTIEVDSPINIEETVTYAFTNSYGFQENMTLIKETETSPVESIGVSGVVFNKDVTLWDSVTNQRQVIPQGQEVAFSYQTQVHDITISGEVQKSYITISQQPVQSEIISNQNEQVQFTSEGEFIIFPSSQTYSQGVQVNQGDNYLVDLDLSQHQWRTQTTRIIPEAEVWVDSDIAYPPSFREGASAIVLEGNVDVEFNGRISVVTAHEASTLLIDGQSYSLEQGEVRNFNYNLTPRQLYTVTVDNGVGYTETFQFLGTEAPEIGTTSTNHFTVENDVVLWGGSFDQTTSLPAGSEIAFQQQTQQFTFPLSSTETATYFAIGASEVQYQVVPKEAGVFSNLNTIYFTSESDFTLFTSGHFDQGIPVSAGQTLSISINELPENGLQSYTTQEISLTGDLQTSLDTDSNTIHIIPESEALLHLGEEIVPIRSGAELSFPADQVQQQEDGSLAIHQFSFVNDQNTLSHNSTVSDFGTDQQIIGLRIDQDGQENWEIFTRNNNGQYTFLGDSSSFEPQTNIFYAVNNQPIAIRLTNDTAYSPLYIRDTETGEYHFVAENIPSSNNIYSYYNGRVVREGNRFFFRQADGGYQFIENSTAIDFSSNGHCLSLNYKVYILNSEGVYEFFHIGDQPEAYADNNVITIHYVDDHAEVLLWDETQQTYQSLTQSTIPVTLHSETANQLILKREYSSNPDNPVDDFLTFFRDNQNNWYQPENNTTWTYDPPQFFNDNNITVLQSVNSSLYQIYFQNQEGQYIPQLSVNNFQNISQLSSSEIWEISSGSSNHTLFYYDQENQYTFLDNLSGTGLSLRSSNTGENTPFILQYQESGRNRYKLYVYNDDGQIEFFGIEESYDEYWLENNILILKQHSGNFEIYGYNPSTQQYELLQVTSENLENSLNLNSTFDGKILHIEYNDNGTKDIVYYLNQDQNWALVGSESTTYNSFQFNNSQSQAIVRLGTNTGQYQTYQILDSGQKNLIGGENTAYTGSSWEIRNSNYILYLNSNTSRDTYFISESGTISLIDQSNSSPGFSPALYSNNSILTVPTGEALYLYQQLPSGEYLQFGHIDLFEISGIYAYYNRTILNIRTENNASYIFAKNESGIYTESFSEEVTSETIEIYTDVRGLKVPYQFEGNIYYKIYIWSETDHSYSLIGDPNLHYFSINLSSLHYSSIDFPSVLDLRYYDSDNQSVSVVYTQDNNNQCQFLNQWDSSINLSFYYPDDDLFLLEIRYPLNNGSSLTQLYLRNEDGSYQTLGANSLGYNEIRYFDSGRIIILDGSERLIQLENGEYQTLETTTGSSNRVTIESEVVHFFSYSYGSRSYYRTYALSQDGTYTLIGNPDINYSHATNYDGVILLRQNNTDLYHFYALNNQGEYQEIYTSNIQNLQSLDNYSNNEILIWNSSSYPSSYQAIIQTEDGSYQLWTDLGESSGNYEELNIYDDGNILVTKVNDSLPSKVYIKNNTGEYILLSNNLAEDSYNQSIEPLVDGNIILIYNQENSFYAFIKESETSFSFAGSFDSYQLSFNDQTLLLKGVTSQLYTENSSGSYQLVNNYQTSQVLLHDISASLVGISYYNSANQQFQYEIYHRNDVEEVFSLWNYDGSSSFDGISYSTGNSSNIISIIHNNHHYIFDFSQNPTQLIQSFTSNSNTGTLSLQDNLLQYDYDLGSNIVHRFFILSENGTYIPINNSEQIYNDINEYFNQKFLLLQSPSTPNYTLLFQPTSESPYIFAEGDITGDLSIYGVNQDSIIQATYQGKRLLFIQQPDGSYQQLITDGQSVYRSVRYINNSQKILLQDSTGNYHLYIKQNGEYTLFKQDEGDIYTQAEYSGQRLILETSEGHQWIYQLLDQEALPQLIGLADQTYVDHNVVDSFLQLKTASGEYQLFIRSPEGVYTQLESRLEARIHSIDTSHEGWTILQTELNTFEVYATQGHDIPLWVGASNVGSSHQYNQIHFVGDRVLARWGQGSEEAPYQWDVLSSSDQWQTYQENGGLENLPNYDNFIRDHDGLTLIFGRSSGPLKSLYAYNPETNSYVKLGNQNTEYTLQQISFSTNQDSIIFHNQDGSYLVYGQQENGFYQLINPSSEQDFTGDLIVVGHQAIALEQPVTILGSSTGHSVLFE